MKKAIILFIGLICALTTQVTVAASENIKLNLVGLNNPKDVNVVGEYINEAEGVPLKQTVQLDANGVANFKVPETNYDTFKYTVQIGTQTVTDSIAMSDIKGNADANYIISNDITWVQMLETVGSTNNTDRVIPAEGSVETITASETSTTDVKTNTEEFEDVKSVIYTHISSNEDISLLKGNIMLHLQNADGSYVINVPLNCVDYQASLTAKDGIYKVSVENTNTNVNINTPNEIVIKNASGSYDIGIQAKCTLEIIDSTQEATYYTIKGVTGERKAQEDYYYGCTPGDTYIIRKKGTSKAYNVQIPMYATEYHIDLGTGKAYVNTKEIAQDVNTEDKTDENPYGIPETNDKTQYVKFDTLLDAIGWVITIVILAVGSYILIQVLLHKVNQLLNDVANKKEEQIDTNNESKKENNREADD
jgi:hypothetical protein